MVYKVYLEDGDEHIKDMFENKGWETTTELDEADLICFGGGSDVSPTLYGEKNTHSHCDLQRDLKCVHLYQYAQRRGVPCVGICRGGQFLHVMNGGKMLQDHKMEAYSHKVRASDGKEYTVTSAHHQVMVSEEGHNGQLHALSSVRSEITEAICYYGTGGRFDLCFQPHPEWVSLEHECSQFFFQLLEDEFSFFNYLYEE